MEINKVADRIRKLLAHAESCTNEAEAATFFSRAATMQMQFSISQEEIMAAQAAAAGRTMSDEPMISALFWEYEKVGELPGWIHVLSSTIARLNHCSSCGYNTGGMRGKRRSYIQIWGRQQDVDVAKEMLRVIVAQVRILCNTYSKRSGVRDNNALRSYRMGATATIQERMNKDRALETAEVQRKALVGECTALVRLTDISKRAEKTMTDQIGPLRTRKLDHGTSSAAYNQGRLDGHTVHSGGHKAIG